MKYLTIILFAGLAGCTDAVWDKTFSLGEGRKIECYSGGKLIYSGVSTGKIQSEQSSDGYFFRDRDTGKLMEVSGNCVLTSK
ncbi:MAG: hypothetical protein GY861_17750 [bacterium]|nr:hypothetical protein [bacterium]